MVNNKPLINSINTINLNEGCPLCNSLISLVQLCPQCHRALIDGGRVEDYLSPYDPYEEVDEPGREHPDNCTHLIYCPICGQDWKVNINP